MHTVYVAGVAAAAAGAGRAPIGAGLKQLQNQQQ